jgi:hypothetical protein
MANADWMKDQPLGRAVEGRRKWGNRWFRDKNTGEQYALTLVFIPDPWNAPKTRYLVCEGESYRFNAEKPWSHRVTIQTENGGWRTMGDLELAGYLDEAHWQFVKETKAARDAAALKTGFVPRVGEYQPARVSDPYNGNDRANGYQPNYQEGELF